MVSIVLLLIYGVSAALGPHWHQHGGVANDGQIVDTVSQPQASDACGCGHGAASELAEHWQAAEGCGSCAVCAYYAQGVIFNSAEPIRGISLLIGEVLPQVTLLATSFLLRANSRGPPAQ